MFKLFFYFAFVLLISRTANSKNLIANLDLDSVWIFGFGGQIYDSEFYSGYSHGEIPALGIKAGRDRQGRWMSKIKSCKEGNRYRFEGEFFRDDRYNSRAYPEVSIWGHHFTLNTHRITGKYQKLWFELECPGILSRENSIFAFINDYPGTSFWMRNPKLFEVNKQNNHISPIVVKKENFFPIGVYQVTAQNLNKIREIGLNTGVIPFNEENVKACLSENMHCTLAVPRDEHKLQELLEKIAPLIKQGRFHFYVNDEPGIHSFPKEKAEAIQRILKKLFPNIPTSMAIVRSWVVPEYMSAADYFLLDQYPVPNMPMIWLSDSMDDAARYVGRERLQSVIQAFGGDNFALGGWSRPPTFEEMNQLAFLSVIHGSRGIYFFTYPEIVGTEKTLKDFKAIVRRLNSLYTWLLVQNDPKEVGVEMVSDYKYGPKGKPAVHCARKEQYSTKMLICANVLRTYVVAKVEANESMSIRWENYFTGEVDYVVNNNLLGRFEPLEVKVWMEQK